MVTVSSQATMRSGKTLILLAILAGFGAAVGQGFGRFGYSLLLPAMQQELQWTYTQAGMMNSANALGYLVGALAVGPLVDRFRATTVVRISLFAVCISLIATGIAVGYWPLLIARTITGVAGACLFVGGGAVMLMIDSSERSAAPMSIYYAGPGVGIALSGLIVPWMMSSLGVSWRIAWVVLGVIGLLVQLLVEYPIREANKQPQIKAEKPKKQSQFMLSDYRLLWPALLAYALFGLGYVGYTTFAIAFLRENNVAELMVRGFWILIGVCAAISGVAWIPIMKRMQPHHNLALLIFMLSVGAALPVLFVENWSFVLSAITFGSAFVVLMTVVTAQVRLALPPERWTMMMGNATALFAVGQLFGPTLTGWLSDTQGGLPLGLRVSALVLLVAAGVALIKPKP